MKDQRSGVADIIAHLRLRLFPAAISSDPTSASFHAACFRLCFGLRMLVG